MHTPHLVGLKHCEAASFVAAGVLEVLSEKTCKSGSHDSWEQHSPQWNSNEAHMVTLYNGRHGSISSSGNLDHAVVAEKIINL